MPVFIITNTYQKGKKDKVNITTYIDGPFFADSNLHKKDAVQDLRNRAYNQMVERSKNSTYEYIIYKKKQKEKTFA